MMAMLIIINKPEEDPRQGNTTPVIVTQKNSQQGQAPADQAHLQQVALRQKWMKKCESNLKLS